MLGGSGLWGASQVRPDGKALTETLDLLRDLREEAVLRPEEVGHQRLEAVPYGGRRALQHVLSRVQDLGLMQRPRS